MKINKINGKCNVSGERVRLEREKLNLSQEKLAAKLQLLGLDVTQKAVSRIETGDRVVADYELIALSKSLGVNVDYLLNI